MSKRNQTEQERERQRLLADAKAGGSQTALDAKQRPGGSHGRRKTPRAVEKRQAIQEHS